MTISSKRSSSVVIRELNELPSDSSRGAGCGSRCDSVVERFARSKKSSARTTKKELSAHSKNGDNCRNRGSAAKRRNLPFYGQFGGCLKRRGIFFLWAAAAPTELR